MNIVEANNLLTRALMSRTQGWGTDYIDNQRRAEILLQELLTKYPQSNKISVAAYWLGDIYESKANEMYRRAAWYYTRCYQWNRRQQRWMPGCGRPASTITSCTIAPRPWNSIATS